MLWYYTFCKLLPSQHFRTCSPAPRREPPELAPTQPTLRVTATAVGTFLVLDASAQARPVRSEFPRRLAQRLVTSCTDQFLSQANPWRGAQRCAVPRTDYIRRRVALKSTTPTMDEHIVGVFFSLLLAAQKTHTAAQRLAFKMSENSCKGRPNSRCKKRRKTDRNSHVSHMPPHTIVPLARNFDEHFEVDVLSRMHL